MKVIDLGWRVHIKSWLPDKGGFAVNDLDGGTLEQAINLANHPVVYHHIALMPDAHSGYGMPIGGVIACEDAVIPNAVGVDIGCGMCSVRTTKKADDVTRRQLREIREKIERHIPIGEGNVHRGEQEWERFEGYLDNKNEYPIWMGEKPRDKLRWYKRSICSLGGGK